MVGPWQFQQAEKGRKQDGSFSSSPHPPFFLLFSLLPPPSSSFSPPLLFEIEFLCVALTILELTL